jgi:hypothetical protein
VFAVKSRKRNEFVEDLDLLPPSDRAVPAPDRHHQLPSRRHAHLPHIRSLPGSILGEAIATLWGAFQARQCAHIIDMGKKSYRFERSMARQKEAQTTSKRKEK